MILTEIVAIYFIYASKKDIFYIPERKRKAQKKLKKTSIFQAFLDKDINSSSGNFIFFTQAWNRVAVIRDQLYRSQVKLKLLAEVWYSV